MCHIIFITIAVLAVVLWHFSSEIQIPVKSPPEIYRLKGTMVIPTPSDIIGVA